MTTTEPAGPRPPLLQYITGAPIPDETTADLVCELGNLILQFGSVPRATFHPDLKMRESDTTHTVMVQMVACCLAEALNSTGNYGFNISRVCFEALFHDLPEAVTGDVNTIVEPDAAAKAAKKAAELDAARGIGKQFGWAFPWMLRYIYPDSREMRMWSKEARLVHFVDKIVPKLAHLACGCADLIADGRTSSSLTYRFVGQRQQLIEEVVYDFPQVIALYDIIVARVIRMVREHG